MDKSEWMEMPGPDEAGETLAEFEGIVSLLVNATDRTEARDYAADLFRMGYAAGYAGRMAEEAEEIALNNGE